MNKDKAKEYFGMVGEMISASGCESVPEIIELVDNRGYEPFNEKGIAYGVYTYGTTLFSLVIENEFNFVIYEIFDYETNKKQIKVSSFVACLGQDNKIKSFCDVEN